MEAGKEILEPYNIPYSHLITLSSSDEIGRLQIVQQQVIKALGPTGDGLLTITGVPNTCKLRNTLLPLARDLSLLPNPLRTPILKDHGLGSDVPLKNLDRSVSSFAMQLKYNDDFYSSNLTCGNCDRSNKESSVVENLVADGFGKSIDHHFKDLSGSFRELGLCMMDLGLRVARICDRAIGGDELEKSLLESGTAKGRLIHYHSSLDTCIIKEAGRRGGVKKRQTKHKPESPHGNGVKVSKKSDKIQRNAAVRPGEKVSDLWQQWHYDYGTFTVLTSPMFIRPRICPAENGKDGCLRFDGEECSSPSGHSYLQILHPDKDKICVVKVPPESFIIQVGESADILSRRKLQSTLHSVSRPLELENISRETFVVFLHPSWNKVFNTSDYPVEEVTPHGQSIEQREGPQEEGTKKVKEDINEKIPPLSSRLKDGMTFAEFSRETTKQYYGGNSLKTNR